MQGKILIRIKLYNIGQTIFSNCRNYNTKLEADGSLCVYSSAHQVHQNCIWHSNTEGEGIPPYSLIFKENGALNLIDG